MWKSAQAAPRTMRFLDPEGLVDDFAKAMARSVDMTTEAAALTRLRANFPPRTGVVFPEALAAQKGALVETYEPGLPLEDALKLLARADADTATAAKRNVAKRGLRALLQMLFKDNFAHGDMHAGNLLVRAPAGGGDALDARAFAARVAAGDFDLVVLDAGLVVELAPTDRRNFVDLFAAVVARDGAKCGDLLLDRARAHACRDRAAFKADVARLVGAATRRGVTLDELRVADLLLDVLNVCRTHGVRLEANFATTVVAITIVEGIGRQLDPDLDLLYEAAPFVLARAAAAVTAR